MLHCSAKTGGTWLSPLWPPIHCMSLSWLPSRSLRMCISDKHSYEHRSLKPWQSGVWFNSSIYWPMPALTSMLPPKRPSMLAWKTSCSSPIRTCSSWSRYFWTAWWPKSSRIQIITGLTHCKQLSIRRCSKKWRQRAKLYRYWRCTCRMLRI